MGRQQMKNLISLIVCFSIISSSFAFESSDIKNSINQFGTVQTTAVKLCIPDANNFQIFTEKYSEICNIIKKDDLCKNINEKEIIQCNDSEENTLDVMSISFLKNCGVGLWNSLKDLWDFLVESVKGLLGYSLYSEKRDQTHQAIGEYYDTFTNYLAIEFDKLQDSDNSASDFEIMTRLAGQLMKTIFTKLGKIIEDNYYNLGCYNQSARQTRVCKIIGDFTMPPAAVIGLIMGVPKLTKKLKTVVNGQINNFKLRSVEPQVIISQGEVRDLTVEGMKRKSDQELPKDLGSSIMKGVAQVGRGVKLLVAKDRITTETPKLHGSLNGIITIDRINELEKSFDLTKITNDWTIDQRRVLGDWLNNLSPTEKDKLKIKKNLLKKDLADMDSKLSLVYSIRESEHLNDSQKNLKEVLEMYSLFIKEEGAKKFKKFNQWVKSDAHALYLYDHISQAGLEPNKDLLRYLVSYNEYFKKSNGTRGPPFTLITYSFEKESKKSNIADWYKVAGVDDKEWFQLDPDVRLEKLKKVTNIKKKGVADSIITATETKPLFLGRYSQELPGADNSFAWEIANKKYEIDLSRTMNQVKTVANTFKENHSFHTHVVFDIPKGYKHFDKFQIWSKQANDYLYLKGMEEGLHGNSLTNIAHFPDDPSVKLDKTISVKLPKTLNQINYQSHKFFSMGIRTEIYGNSPLNDHIKLGLELRDTTRNLDTLTNHMHKISDSVSGFRWENWDLANKKEDFVFLRPDPKLIEDKLDSVLSKNFRRLLIDLDINTSIPLLDFENATYFNFKTQKMVPVTEEQKARFIKGREHFISELKNIEAELKRMSERKESYEKEDVKMALKMTLTEWARIARASELYENL